MKIEDLKIKVKPKYNYGYKVGVTVHINGETFPKNGYVYAHNRKNKAVISAMIEAKLYDDHELVFTTLQKEMKERGKQ